MDAQKLIKKIDELKDKYLQFWIDVCNIESPTTYKPGVDAVGKYFAKKAEEKGWKVEVRKEEGSGDAVCITLNPDAPGKAVCFSGHMDTVHPVGSFGTPAVRVEGDTIYGPGVKDCKGGCVASFLAMEALEECGFTARPVKLILQSDEENTSVTSGRDTVDFMEQCAKGCEVFLNTEGHQRDKATLWRKGLSKYRMTVTGQATHAAGCWKEGVSAVREAAYKIVELEQFKEQFGITMNCGTITGGSAINVVPASCEFTIDVRYPTVADMEKAHRFLTDLAAKSFVEGTTAELYRISARPPMEKNEVNAAMLQRLNDAYASAGLPVLTEKGNSGGSDGADMSVRGIPTVDSLGVCGTKTHSVFEQAEIPSLAECAKRLAVAAALI